MSFGIYCDKFDVFRSVFDNILEKKKNVSIAICVSSLLKLDNERSKQKLSWSEFSFVVSNLVDDDAAHITSSSPRFFFKKAMKNN